jgi:hypothetical protein
LRRLALLLVCAALVLGLGAPPAAAFNPVKSVCSLASLASGLLGKVCGVAQDPGRILSAGKQILGGHFGGAVKSVLGDAGRAVGSGAKAALSLAAIGAWVLGGARFALHETAKVLSETTTPQLGTSWFSTTYWRVAGIGALLTLPFLFAATIQALAHSDMALLLRSVLGYLPLAMLVVSVAAPVTMLLLAGSDELSGLVSSAAGQPGSRALTLGGVLAGGLSALTGSPFLIFFLGLLTVAGTIALWMELLVREAAVYVVVLLLPLAFAAFVWPARRTWAIRAVELLVALILSKFAIVAVLSLGGAAMDQVGHSLTAPIIGLVLVVMAAFAPWALLRLVPLAELAGAAVESLRGPGRILAGRAEHPYAVGLAGDEWAATTTSEMRRTADDASPVPLRRSSNAPVGGPVVAADGPAESSDAPAEGDAVDVSQDAVGASALGAGAAGQTGGQSRPAPDSRLPGLPNMWQADDLSWHPLTLGTEDGWPPQVWPHFEGGQPGTPAPADGPPPVEPPLGQPQPSGGLDGLPQPEAAPVPEAAPSPEPPPPADPAA